MNEKQLFELAVKNGYTKGINEFRALMSSNKKAVDDMFKIAKANGYTKKINDFTTFVGFGGKKKKSLQQQQEKSLQQLLYHLQNKETSILHRIQKFSIRLRLWVLQI